MTIYTFHEPGSIPGIPGTFAYCRVTVSDSDGSVVAIGPLDSSGFVPTLTSVIPNATIEEEAAAPPPVEEAAPVPLVAPVTQYIGG